MPAKTKVCTKCGKRKKLEEYHAHNGRKAGRRAHCKECMCATMARYRAENKEKIAARGARYRARPEVREQKRVRRADWRARNREWHNVQQQLRRIGGF